MVYIFAYKIYTYKEIQTWIKYFQYTEKIIQ